MTATASDSKKNRPPDSITDLMVALSGEDGMARLHARSQLVEFGSLAVPFLIDALSDPKRQVRWEAAKALGDIADPRAAEAFVRALDDDAPGVRWLAAEALVALGVAAFVPTLKGLLKHSASVAFRSGAHHILCGLHDVVPENVTTPILEALTGSAPEVTTPVVASQTLNALSTRESK